MRAITLHQPWSWAIAHAGKRIENRDWGPPSWIIGKKIAIHAGKKLEKDAADDLRHQATGGTIPMEGLIIAVPVPDVFVQGAIESVATVIGWCEGISETHPQHGWFCGPRGWVLAADVFVLPEPVPCRGYQKIWMLPDDVEANVRAQVAKAA